MSAAALELDGSSEIQARVGKGKQGTLLKAGYQWRSFRRQSLVLVFWWFWWF